MIGGHAPANFSSFSPSDLVTAALREMMLGLLFVVAFQVTFAALLFAGRTIDIQAGFGLAMVIDPSSKSQMPLTGTLFAYLAGAVFFLCDGHHDLLRTFSASLDVVPLGNWTMTDSLDRLGAFISSVFISGIGVAGATIGILFLVDLGIAVLSRTVPQMNALLLGLQVKTLVFLLVLPVSIGLASALLARMMRLLIEAIPRLM